MIHFVRPESGVPASSRRKLAAALPTVLWLAIAPVVAIGQAAPDPTQSDADRLPEIIVTAQKRSEDVQKVPISISTLTTDQIRDQRITNITAIAGQVPNFQITEPYGDTFPIFAIRGVSAVDFALNQSSPVALYVDEVYKGLPVFTALQVFDVERLEVLKGPQGTLFGKNTTGGAVSFHTSTASLTDGLSGYIDAGIGRFNRRELSAAVNLPIIDDTLASRVAFTTTRADGFVKNLLPGHPAAGALKEWAARVSTRWRPRDGLEFTLRATATESNPTGYDTIADNIGKAGPGGIAFATGYTRDGLSYLQDESDTTGVIRIRNKSISLTGVWELAQNVALTSVTSYDAGHWFVTEDGDGSPFYLNVNRYQSTAHSWGQDLRLGSMRDGNFNWLVGVFGYRDSASNKAQLNYLYSFAGLDAQGQPLCFSDGFTGCNYSDRLKQERRSIAVYSQESIKLTPDLSVTAGLRYTKDRNRLAYYQAGLGYLDPLTGEEFTNVVPTIDSPPVDGFENSNISGRLAIDYQISARTMAYASLSRRFRGGAFAGQAMFSPTEVTVAAPERLDSAEVGLKMDSAGGRLRFNTAAFLYRYKNQQFLSIRPDLTNVLYNVPRSRLYGAEFELTAKPIPTLDIRLGGSYLNGAYQEAVLSGIDVSGNTMVLAPKWSLMGGIDWRFARTPAGIFTLHSDSRYTGKQYFDPFNIESVAQGAYMIHDARLGFEAASLPIRVGLWVKNLTDKQYRTFRVDVSSFNYDYAHRGRPREYGLDVAYRF